MTSLKILYQFARADFLERVRRVSFLIMLLATLGVTYLSVPPTDSKIVTVALGNIRGIYNMPWIAGMLAIMCSSFLSLIGFYLVKNALERDRQTRVGQILNSSPTSTFIYLLGKALSNLMLLAAVVGVIMISAVLMQFIRGESSSIDLVQLVAPFLFMTLPFMAVIASIAVLFESVTWLRGTLGNVAYFFFWVFVIIVSMESQMIKGRQIIEAGNDAAGMTVLLHSMTVKAVEVYPDYNGEIAIGASIVQVGALDRRITWEGVDWTLGIVIQRLLWFLVAIGIVAGATYPYRWQTARESLPQAKKKSPENPAEEEPAPTALPAPVHFKPLTVSPRYPWYGLFRSELTLALKSPGKWWYLLVGGMLIAQLVTPYSVSRQYLLPVTWILPLAIWSALGCRDRICGTEELISSSPRVILRQLAALIFAGSAVAAISGSGTLIRELIAGDTMALIGWCCAVIAIPTAATAIGTISGGRKIFEITYTLLWYAGPLNSVSVLDFMGAVPRTSLPWCALVTLVMSIALLTIAVMVRYRRTA